MKRVFLLCVLFLLSVGVFAAKIDLAVSSSDVTISPSQPKAGDAVSVSVKIHNEGTKASKASIVKLKITKGTTKIFNQKNSIPAIAAGESYDTLFSVGALQEATYTLLIKVDPANAIPETNEGNNKLTITLVVSGGGASATVGTAGATILYSTQNSFNSFFDTFSQGLGAGGGGKNEKGILNLIEFIKSAPYLNPEVTVPCSKGGYVDINYTLDSYMRPNIFSMTYNNCEQWIDQASNSYIVSNGFMGMTLTYASDNILDPAFYQISAMSLKAGDGNPSSDTSPDYTCSIYEHNNKISTVSSDYTMNVSIFGYNGDMPSDLGIYINGTQTLQDFVANATVTNSFSNFHFDVAVSGTETDMTTTGVAAGTISCQSTLPDNCNQSFTITYNNLNFTDHTTTVQSETTINGQVAYSSKSFSGTFSIETLETIITPAGSACPTSGKIKVTGPNENATIIYNADGTVSIDEGSNGTIDHTYPLCNECVDNGDPC